MSTITVNGIEYVPKSSQPTGSRHVVVLHRGWIFVGNISEEDGQVTLTGVRNVRKWASGGFGGMIRDPKGSGAETDACGDLGYRADTAEIMRLPVAETWGE